MTSSNENQKDNNRDEDANSNNKVQEDEELIWHKTLPEWLQEELMKEESKREQFFNWLRGFLRRK